MKNIIDIEKKNNFNIPQNYFEDFENQLIYYIMLNIKYLDNDKKYEVIKK